MKRLVAKGCDVTLFTSSFEGGLKEEVIDGVHIVRDGNKLSVYKKAKRFYKQSLGQFDIVVDEINTVPFMAPSFVKDGTKVVALIHQLAREFWYYEMPYPVAWLGYHYFEKHWLKKYQKIPTITVSNSTKVELLQLGFDNVSIVPNGINVAPLNQASVKAIEPTMLFLGRMKKAKKPQDAVGAFNILRKKHPQLRMVVAGDGYLRHQLQKENPEVNFLGYVDKNTRDELVRTSWIIAVPGVREGWGQVVTDANALGTPAVGYDIPGLRDSIKNGHNGILTEPSPAALADGIDRLLSDQLLRAEMSRNAIEWAKQFSWDKSAEAFEAILKGV